MRPKPKTYFLFGVFSGFLSLLLAVGAAWGQTSVLTYHNDQARDGWNQSETTLTTANVNQSTFGKLFSDSVDGQVYAQPLYVPNVSIGGGTHNVVYIVTEHDSAYAFDADSAGVTYWHMSYIGGAVTTVAQADVGNCSQITPEIGITDTPVIDPATGTMYFVAMTKVVSGGVTTYLQQLHAVDITNGNEKFNGPTTIQATDPANSAVTFIARAHKERCALTLVNGVVYTAFTSHCDFNSLGGNYHGWVIGYNASNISQQLSVYDTAPTGTEASLWESGDGPSVDSNGNLYFLTANGSFDQTGPVTNFGQCFLKLNTKSNAVSALDYFSPMNEATLSSGDQDIGSAGQCLLPASWGSAAHPNLVIGADKPGDLYVVDTANMGHFSSTANNIPQMLVSIGGRGYTTPAIYSNGVTNYVYWGMTGQPLRCYTFANGVYNPTTAASQSSASFGSQGCVPSVSSNGDTNGIVWALQSGTPVTLHAYNATNLGTELYNSGQAAGSRDSAVGAYVKFAPPSIANGKVYVPTANSLVVYGLLASGTPTNTPINTRTNTPGNSPTNTLTATRTNTPLNTPTPTMSNTATATRTNTAVNTSTPTRTNTPVNTPTGTATPSPTNSQANTPTNSATGTRTNTPVNTPTLTPTNSATLTPTSSATSTKTNTPPNTPTNTRTLTPTNTSVSTATPTPTSSATSTATNSQTATRTNTPLNTPTNSATPSATNSATSSSTNTPTSSPTLTPTATSSNTSTSSATITDTHTPTMTGTTTPTTTFTVTDTPSVTNTLTATPSSTPTNSATPSLTNTPTFTATATTTNSATFTATNSSTGTPTAVTVTVSNLPPANSTQLPGTANVPAGTIVLSNPGSTAITITGLTVTESGSGNPASGITNLVVSNGATGVTTTLSGATAIFTLNTIIPAGGSVTLTLDVNFASPGSTGTYISSVTGATGTNGQPVNFNGLPAAGNTITVATATATPSTTASLTSTATPTPTTGSTVVSTPTPEGTCPPTTVSNPYPNPSKGVPVNVDLNNPCSVHVQWAVYTTSFRKVAWGALDLSGQQTLTWDLTDHWGNPVANGMYYLWVKSGSNKPVLRKMLLWGS